MASDTQRRAPWKHETESVAGKSVIVTGGTTGIGRAIAILLVSQGARVLVFGREEDALNDALADIRAAADGGGEVFGLTADQSRHEDILRVFQEADRHLGGVDMLINNAAVAGGSILELDYAEFEYMVRTNVVGYMACTKEAIQRMKARGWGHVLCVGSMSADLKEAGSDVYVATKTAIAGFCESLRKQVNEQGIKVTLIEPGKVGSDMNPSNMEEVEQGKALTAEDIAECVYFVVTQPRRNDIVTVEIRPHLQAI